jgi:Domain of unknown function (DUF4412)
MKGKKMSPVVLKPIQLRLPLFFVTLCAAVLVIACSTANQPASTDSSSSKVSPASGSTSSVDQFEGVITLNIIDDSGSDPKNGRMIYSVKGNLTRMDNPERTSKDGGSGSMLMDSKAGIMRIIVPERKSYMEMDLNAFKGTGKDDEEPIPKMTPTGKRETIAGHTCDHYRLDDKEQTDLCLAKGLGYFGFGNAERGGIWQTLKTMNQSDKVTAQIAADPDLKKAMEGGAFPLKVSQTENGKVVTVMEVTSIERKKLDDSLFIVPPDYKKMEFPMGMPQR